MKKTSSRKQKFNLDIILYLIFFGAFSIFATIIHELGHLFFAYLSGGTNLKLDFDFLGASHAIWTGPQTFLTTIGGVVIPIIVGSTLLPFVLFMVKKRRFKVMWLLFVIELIPSSFLYIAISTLIKWGDGYRLVQAYYINSSLIFVITGICGVLSFLYLFYMILFELRESFKNSFTRRLLFSMAFWGIILSFRFFTKDFMKYTSDYILMIYLTLSCLLSLLKFEKRFQKPSDITENSQ
ncbi:hypothetical protein GF357_04645 [Candidatus Dojkabacteria bacterium]|nr:hypothetical protein [Candidatus Dojkabacteria bacterium]